MSTRSDDLTGHTVPDWPTMVRSKLTGGRLQGVDGSLWLYRAVPMSPVRDAKTADDGLAAAAPLVLALNELAAATPTKMNRRMSRQSYRHIHVLQVNIPTLFYPPIDHPLGDYLRTSFPRQETVRRVLLLGVRLEAKVGGEGGWRKAIDSVAETLAMGGTPLEDFDPDYKAVDAMLRRSGLQVPSADDLRLATAWWNEGNAPDVPVVVGHDRLHVFTSLEAAQAAKRAGPGADLVDLGAGHHVVTFASVSDMDLPFVDATDPRALWASQLLDLDAMAVSVRGQLEPGAITRTELRRNRKAYQDDIRERVSSGKMEKAEQLEREQALAEVEQVYATGAPPTLTGTSIVVGFNGYVPDMAELSRDLTVNLLPMWYRQRSALAETMLCSPVRANPHLQDLPAQSLAASGLPSLSVVGDSTGALVGFTESDRQPAYMHPMAATDADTLPMCLAVGQTGSGKTMGLLWLADQFARASTPTIIIDPKMGSDHTQAVTASGGQVSSLDELASADGIFDPIRFSDRPEVGVELAASMLMSVNPWGSKKDDYEAPLQYALHYGVQRGATCVGQALEIAKEHGQAPAEMVDAAFRLAQSSTMFRAIFGISPTTEGLRVAEGITLIKVGSANLDLPAPGQTGQASLPQRVAMALVRMMVFGSAIALTGRDGVVMLDEAWVFMAAGREEVERLGRLARSQRVFPVLFTQRVTDALNAGLAGYISRGLIGSIQDRTEALAACELFGLEPTAERIARITAKATVGASAEPNYDSMRALVEAGSRKVLRGAVWLYCDVNGRAVPVEIVLPAEFLKRASTNAAEIRARQGDTAPVGPAAASTVGTSGPVRPLHAVPTPATAPQGPTPVAPVRTGTGDWMF